MAGKCGYAPPGTYGHECGRPAKWAQKSPDPDGWLVFWCLRCDECRTADGRDNWDMKPDGWLPYDPDTQRHRYVKNRWPLDPVEVERPA